MAPNDTRPSRLKPVQIDLLEAIGLPSKGKKGLTSFSAQQEYFDLLQTRAKDIGLQNTTDTTATNSNADQDPNEVAAKLETLSLNRHSRTLPTKAQSQHELAVVLSAMRKLRESLIATQRYDRFTVSVYLFITRSTIPIEHHEAYHPALLHALRVLSRHCQMLASEHQELAAYAVLDLAGRQDAIREAWDAAWTYGLFALTDSSRQGNGRLQADPSREDRSQQIRAILRAAIHGDMLAFHQRKQHLSTNEQVLIRPLEQRLAIRAVGCLSRAYFAADLSYVVKVLGLRWHERQERQIAHATSSWQLEGEKLIFRRPKVR